VGKTSPQLVGRAVKYGQTLVPAKERLMTAPRLRAPVVLIHGLLGFDQVRMGPWVLANYFRGVPEVLAAGGNRVLIARVSPTGGIADRAAQLKVFLEQSCPGEPVHLIGHSMGGLDARYLICHLGMAPSVLTLTTVGTPHRGSPFADWGVGRLARVVRPVLDFLGLPYQAFYDLTVANCAQFNRTTPDAPGVRYFSVAGRHELGWHTPEWLLPARIVESAEGPNDGIVSVRSARWGQDCEVWEGDHLSLVNWPRRLVPGRLQQDHTADYVRLVRRLADEGF
jgi:triacylglycerol lipase